VTIRAKNFAHATDMAKETQKINAWSVLSIEYFGFNHVYLLSIDPQERDFLSILGQTFLFFLLHLKKSAINQSLHSMRQIATYYQKFFQLNFGLHRNLQWFFYLAEVNMPILGIGFISF